MKKLTSRKNPLAVHMKKLGVSGAYRREHGEFLCDGLKLLEEALKSGAEVTAVLTVQPVPFPLPVDSRVFLATRDLIDSLSPLKNAQDVLFSCKIPQKTREFDVSGFHILLDGLQDPGNVGTTLRTADAFGVKSVLLQGSCADPFGPKTIRASMGAVFRQSFYSISLTELTELVTGGARLIGAASGGDSRDIAEVQLKNAIVAVGSEGQGLSPEVLKLCGERLWIPVAPACESLNAAISAAIIMYLATQ